MEKTNEWWVETWGACGMTEVDGQGYGEDKWMTSRDMRCMRHDWGWRTRLWRRQMNDEWRHEVHATWLRLTDKAMEKTNEWRVETWCACGMTEVDGQGYGEDKWMTSRDMRCMRNDWGWRTRLWRRQMNDEWRHEVHATWLRLTDKAMEKTNEWRVETWGACGMTEVDGQGYGEDKWMTSRNMRCMRNDWGWRTWLWRRQMSDE